MKGFKEHTNLFNSHIENFINDLNDNSVYEPIKYFLKLRSKRVRPILTLIASRLYNNNTDYALSAALANELFHNFTLIHDDIMDSSKIRRGKETVHLKWTVNQAILSGDAMQILAYKCLENYEANIQKKLIEIFNDTALKICEGQQLDIEFEKENELKFSDYIQMIKYKTAVLLGSSLKMGGIINNVSESDLESLYEIGLNLGLAFQIQDDYLDLYGDQKLIGKKIGGDVMKRKKTVMYHIYKEISSAKDSQILDQVYNAPESNDDSKIQKVFDLFKQAKVDVKTKDLVKEYSSKAINSLENLNAKNHEKSDLILICNNLIFRAY